ncbi:MAG: GxxExxY protein [Ectothiorhodospiraceae bacterium]|jgi:GxxExxY protein|nr:GxxExxY protein [Ectothiorhodospiraceae bacterium]
MDENDIGTCVVEAAMQVHRELGPGLLETVYEVCLAHELRQRGLQVERQVSMPIVYRGVRFEEGFRADLLVDEKVLVELKCVEAINNAHKKQVLTYLRLSKTRLGYLMNFSVNLMRDGITRIVNGLDDDTWRSRVMPVDGPGSRGDQE